MRVYFLDSEYIVQEYCFTEGKNWYPGEVGKLKARASPLSRLSAVVYRGGESEGLHIRVYYQGEWVCPRSAMYLLKRLEAHGSHVIGELCNDGYWHTGELHIKDAVEGTGIAAVTYAAEGFRQIRVYYQTFEELYLKEYCHNNRGWFPGEQISPLYAIRATDYNFLPKAD